MQTKPLVLISKCLVGEVCRYNGEALPNLLHSKDHQAALLQCELLPFCPEVAAGMPIPRPPLHLVVGSPSPFSSLSPSLFSSHVHKQETPKLYTENGNQDHAPKLRQVAEAFLAEATAAGRLGTGRSIAGAILKEKSPSCGVEECKIYQNEYCGPSLQKGAGVFTRLLLEKAGPIPVITENKLLEDLASLDFFYNIMVESIEKRP